MGEDMNAAMIVEQVLAEHGVAGAATTGDVASAFGIASAVCDRLAAAGMLVDPDSALCDENHYVEQVRGGMHTIRGDGHGVGFIDLEVQTVPRYGDGITFKMNTPRGSESVVMPAVGDALRLLVLPGGKPQRERTAPVIDLAKLGERG